MIKVSGHLAGSRKKPVYHAGPNDAYAIVTHANGSVSRFEFYYGSGYLSQSSRNIFLFRPELRVLRSLISRAITAH